MTQYARPDSDISGGGDWNPGDDSGGSPEDLYATIDESSADDNDYISATDDSGEGTTCEVGLSNVTDPSNHSNHKVKVRAKSDAGSGVSLVIKLMMGSTEISSDTVTLSDSYQLFEPAALTNGEATNIGGQSGYNDLRLRFTYTDDNMDGDEVFISQAYVEFPDVAAAAPAAEPDLPGAAFLMFVD